MTTVQKDKITTASDSTNKQEKAQRPTSSKKNKKMFVYIPEKKEEPQINEVGNIKEDLQQTKLVQPSDATIKSNDEKESQTAPSQKKNNKQKKNKKRFVYTPGKKEKKDEKENDNSKSTSDIQIQPDLKQIEPNQINLEINNNDNEKKKDDKINNKQNNSKKSQKKKFVYIPEKVEEKSNKPDETKELNANTNPTPNNNNNKTHNKNNNNNNSNKNNNNNNKCKNNNKNNNNNNNYKPNNYKINETSRKENQRCEKEKEPVHYNTYFELDMHGSDPHAKRPLEWVPVIRDALFSALEKNVDDVRFIPGKGLHSNPEIGPILRILVLLTSKRLGFESIINPDNEGVIICKVTNHSKSSAIVPHMPNKDEQEDLNRNDTLLKAFGMKLGDNLNIDNLSFQAVKARFPHMPTICIAIICVKRTPKEAVEFAQSFEDSLRSDNEIEIINENDNQELLKEMKMIETLEEKYGFNQEIIERVVREKRKEKKSQIILDRISSEIPSNFFNYLTEFLLNFSHVPIETLLDSMKEGLYNPKEITQILNSKSWRGMHNALGVMKVDNKIKTDRTDGRPKFIPTIEIDLSKAGSQKAQMTLDKIMNGLGNGNFSEMVLLMAPKNQKSNKCTLSDIAMFLYNKANQEGFHIVRTKRADEKNNRYHFTIFNCKDEI